MTPLLAQRLRTDRSFERLYRRHVADVYHYALAVCRNPADAEDVTQTTFMNAYRAIQGGEQPRAPKNWLLAIAHNVMRQRFRASSRRPNEVELAADVAAVVPEENGYSAEDIRRGLSELAFNQRAALVMRELEGRSYAEIAEILGLSVGAVETLIFRARRALREQLEESLTCREAELAISRQLDGRLSRAEKGALRAHLRTCTECASFARSQRAQRTALKGLAAIPLPASLTSLFGGGAAVGTTVAAKAAAVTALGLLVAGGSVETARHVGHHNRPTVAAAATQTGDAKRATDAGAIAAQHGVRVTPARKPTTQNIVSPKTKPVKARHVPQHAVKSKPPGAVTKPASPTLPPTSNGARGRRAHGAPSFQHPLHPVKPVTPAPQSPNARVVHTPPAKSHATTARGRAVGRTNAPGQAHGNGNGNGNGHVKVLPPVDEPAPVADPTETVGGPITLP